MRSLQTNKNSEYYLFGFDMYYMIALFKYIRTAFNFLYFNFVFPDHYLTGEKEGSQVNLIFWFT